MIDKEGKIFGIINVIDLFIIILVVGMGAFIFMRFGGGGSGDSGVGTTEKTYIMSFYSEEVPDFVAENVKVGSPVEDELKNIGLGTITDVKTDQGYMYVPDAQGQLQKAPKEGYSSIEITSELQATPFDNGVIVDGNKYSVGHTFTIRAGDAKIYLKISGIQEKGAQ